MGTLILSCDPKRTNPLSFWGSKSVDFLSIVSESMSTRPIPLFVVSEDGEDDERGLLLLLLSSSELIIIFIGFCSKLNKPWKIIEELEKYEVGLVILVLK